MRRLGNSLQIVNDGTAEVELKSPFCPPLSKGELAQEKKFPLFEKEG